MKLLLFHFDKFIIFNLNILIFLFKNVIFHLYYFNYINKYKLDFNHYN
jgi:hypothetical protein